MTLSLSLSFLIWKMGLVPPLPSKRLGEGRPVQGPALGVPRFVESEEEESGEAGDREPRF